MSTIDRSDRANTVQSLVPATGVLAAKRLRAYASSMAPDSGSY
jgi:hypothetical protein